jgi:hypothetical protein
MAPLISTRGSPGAGDLMQVSFGSGTGELLGLGDVEMLATGLGEADTTLVGLGEGDKPACWPPQPTTANAASIAPATFRTHRA